MYRFLALTQRFYGYTGEAIETWRTLVKMSPNSTDAVGQLGGLLIGEKKFGEAVEPLQAALTTEPGNVKIGLLLAEALLRGNKKPEGDALLIKMRDHLSDSSSMNGAAYVLADTDTDLPLATELAEKAVTDLESQSKELTLANLTAEDLRRVNTLGAAWDTLGWVYFRSGELARAEKFVIASWMLLEHSAAGDHLGQIFEKQGKREAAMHAYELALAVHDLPETRDRLLKLRALEAKGTEPKAASKYVSPKPFVVQPREELGRLRSTALPELTQKQGSAEVFVLFSASKVIDVQFISGDEDLEKTTAAISRSHFSNVPFPDDGPERIVRRGILSCSQYTTPSCNLVFLLPANTTK
jgi:tetratricopeptide (TPR) repeat protein